MSAISGNANSAVNAVTGNASAMVSVPEIENDPQAARKLAVAVFHLADALKRADQEIEQLRTMVNELRGIRPW